MGVTNYLLSGVILQETPKNCGELAGTPLKTNISYPLKINGWSREKNPIVIVPF